MLKERLLFTIIISLCIIVISLFSLQIMESYTTYVVGSEEYVSKPWYTAGGAQYYMGGGKNITHHQNVIDYMGQPSGTKFVSGVLAGNDGKIPIIDNENIDDEHPNSSYHTKIQNHPDEKEVFWYDMNRLEDDSQWNREELDPEVKHILDNEEEWRTGLIEKKISANIYNIQDVEKSVSRTVTDPRVVSPEEVMEPIKKKVIGGVHNTQIVNRVVKDPRLAPTEEGFGNNRAPSDWNVKDYPIVTSNGLNLTPSFPQDAVVDVNMFKTITTERLWGGYDDYTSNQMNKEAQMKSRSVVDHTTRV